MKTCSDNPAVEIGWGPWKDRVFLTDEHFEVLRRLRDGKRKTLPGGPRSRKWGSFWTIVLKHQLVDRVGLSKQFRLTPKGRKAVAQWERGQMSPKRKRVNNPIVAEGSDLRTPQDRNVDEMAQAARRFGEMWATYLDRHRARYKISWGVFPEGDVKITDDSGTYTTRLPMRFEVQTAVCFEGERPDDEDLSLQGDRFLQESGLGEFLYYDGWESGNCDSDHWPRNFWYEQDRTGDLYTYVSFEDHEFRVHMESPSTKKLKSRLMR